MSTQRKPEFVDEEVSERAVQQYLEANPDFVRETLKKGAEHARKIAAQVLSRAQHACGLR